MNRENEVETYQNSLVAARIQSQISPLAQKFYLVTEDQMDWYSELGFLVNFLLTLFGLFGGGAISCWVGTKQSNLPAELFLSVKTAFLFCLLLTLLFLVLSILLIVKQRKVKQRMLTSSY
jgi:uncharacterized membrane protein